MTEPYNVPASKQSCLLGININNVEQLAECLSRIQKKINPYEPNGCEAGEVRGMVYQICLASSPN
jgi:hypothetical protein